MITKLHMTVEASGCPTACQHCWAQGTGYGEIPTGTLAWVLDGARSFCNARVLKFSAFPMHEALSHSDAAEMLLLFRDVNDDGYEPWATAGVPLAIRDDWREVLATLALLGTKTLAFAMPAGIL